MLPTTKVCKCSMVTFFVTKEDLMDGLRTLLNIPKEIYPFSLIAVGYPAEEKTKPERFDEQRIHYNKW